MLVSFQLIPQTIKMEANNDNNKTSFTITLTTTCTHTPRVVSHKACSLGTESGVGTIQTLPMIIIINIFPLRIVLAYKQYIFFSSPQMSTTIPPGIVRPVYITCGFRGCVSPVRLDFSVGSRECCFPPWAPAQFIGPPP